jgi:hypothetical protein
MSNDLFVIFESNKKKLTCSIEEFWIDIDQAYVAKCGEKTSYTLKKTIGLSEKDIEKISLGITSKIGIGIVDIKSTLNKQFQKEVCFHTILEEEFTSEFTAPECGE